MRIRIKKGKGYGYSRRASPMQISAKCDERKGFCVYFKPQFQAGLLPNPTRQCQCFSQWSFTLRVHRASFCFRFESFLWTAIWWYFGQSAWLRLFRGRTCLQIWQGRGSWVLGEACIVNRTVVHFSSCSIFRGSNICRDQFA